MLKKHLLCAVVALIALVAQAQQDTVRMRYAATITEADLRKHLDVLASDEYEGRETGFKGQKRAAEYLKQAFASFGIPPVPIADEQRVVDGYFQPFGLEVEQPGSLALLVEGKRLGFLQDQLYFSKRVAGALEMDKVVYTAPAGLAQLPEGTRAAIVVLPMSSAGGAVDLQQLSALSGQFSKRGGELLLICAEAFGATTMEYAHWLGGTRMRLADEATKEAARTGVQTFVLSPAAGAAILAKGNLAFAKEVKKAKRGRPVRAKTITIPLSVSDQPVVTPLSSENVLGYVEGTDKREELVIVTAHYDHIGAHDGEVYNGADDDGSGTVALIEMAEAFALAKKEGRGPRRSMLFMPVSAEEKGLLGSEYYSEHPVFPLERTVCDLNIDMIGRFDSAHAKSAPYVYIIGSNRLSTELHEVNQRANDVYVGLDLDERFNAADDPNRFYYRSDHYNFARKGVPVIFYFSGVHEDYHQPGDEVQKIRFDLLHQRTLLVFHTAWEVANREKRLVVDGKVEEGRD